MQFSWFGHKQAHRDVLYYDNGPRHRIGPPVIHTAPSPKFGRVVSQIAVLYPEIRAVIGVIEVKPGVDARKDHPQPQSDPAPPLGTPLPNDAHKKIGRYGAPKFL